MCIDMMSNAIVILERSLIVILISITGSADALVRNEREARKYFRTCCTSYAGEGARAPSVLGA